MNPLASRLRAALGPTYELGPELGRGGMGVVFRATDRRLRRDVAVKVLPPDLGYAPELRARFVREAQMAAQLSHPNIVPIYDVGERNDLVWFVMALVDGESVRAKVEREGPQPLSVVRRVLEQVAQALAYAHAKGVVHRDVKPDNILLERATGRALVTDFGIAKPLDPGDTEVTRPGEIVGTARYMAPEQAMGERDVGARADIYALGLVGYFMIAGEHAIKGTTLPAVITEHARGAVVDFAGSGRRLPAPLVAALRRCVQPRPDERFQRLEEFAEQLRELGGELPDIPAPVRRFLRETERAFFLTTVVAFALGLVGVENVPPALVALLAFGTIVNWVSALEHLGREGMGWAAVRRAVYVERAKRVEEARPTVEQHWGIAGAAVFGLGVAVMLLAGESGFGADSWINMVLFWFGVGGAIWAAGVFGIRRAQQRPTGSKPLSPGVLRAVLAGVGLVLLLVVAAFLAEGRLALRQVPGVLLATAFVLGLFAVIGWVAYRTARRFWRGAQRLATRWGFFAAVDPHEWRVPGWLDMLGSWLFARITRDGWRIRIEREQPAAAVPGLDIRPARLALSEIRQLRARLAGTKTTWHAGKAEDLASSLVRECESMARRSRGLTAKMARLQDGVLASRTIAAGGSLESELDRVEAEVDDLRARGHEYLRMLRALKLGLEASVEAKDTAKLEAALAEVRKLSLAVERRDHIAAVTFP